MRDVPPDATFDSVEQFTAATGLPAAVLKFARRHADAVEDLNGCQYSNRIKWALLKPWLEDHEEELENIGGDDYETWKTAKTKAQAELAQIELEEKKGRLIEKHKVHDLLKAIASAQCSLFNSKFRQELPPKLLGKSVPEMTARIDEALSEVFDIMRKPLEKWN